MIKRELKFRAWDKNEKRMYYDIEKCGEGHPIFLQGGRALVEDCFGDLIKDSSVVIEQCTGVVKSCFVKNLIR